MKKIIKDRIIISQAISFVVMVTVLPLLFSESSCNRTKTSETKTIVDQLNDSKFEKIKDQKNAAFLVVTAEIYLREIKLAQLVQQRATQIDVKELGRMNEEFHTHQLMSLIKLAKTKSISIPTSPNMLDEKIYTSINSKCKYAFDKAYCDEVISSQNKSINFFEKVIAETTDEDIKDWASHVLPKMEQQLSYALTCQKNIIRWQQYSSLML